MVGNETRPLALALGLGDAGQELAPAARAECAMNGFDVLVHRVRGEIQLVGELLLTGSDHQLCQDLPLTWGQPRAFFALDAIPIVGQLFVQELDHQGGPELDQPIQERYGTLVEAAIAGELDAWQRSVSGRLALLILLDQFTRNIYRGTARAYSGDAAALTLALDTIDCGAHRSYSLEERLFVLTPLVHAESVEMLSRAVLLADAMVSEAPAELRESWAFGAQRVRKYHALIERFGRYPGRNAALGRSSSAAELAYLAEETARENPLAALAASA